MCPALLRIDSPPAFAKAVEITRKQREKQEDLWVAQQELASAPGHPFYQKVNELLEAERFGEFVESRCAKSYAERSGRPSLTPEMRKSRQVTWTNNLHRQLALPSSYFSSSDCLPIG